MFGALRPYLPWLATSLLAIGLILSNDLPQIAALRNNFSDLVVIGSQPFITVLRAPGIWRENTRLRKTLAEMSLKLARAGDSVSENELLRRMLEFKRESRFVLLTGEVIGLNPDAGIRGVLLNIGEADGVTRDCAVITPDGVVGRVYDVGDHSSVVQLLIDPNIGIAGRLQSNGEDGIVHAAGGRMLTFDGIPVTVPVQSSDLVVTSGLGGIFPSGIPVGTTTDIIKDASGWLWEIKVEPAVNFGRLSQLFVIRNLGDGG